VVWTNGCFDLLHVGHIRSFRDAKALGDILIVGINSDSSVRSLKGDARPIVNQEDRAELIAALEMVDYVTIFDEPTPVAAIARLRPDIHCKGAEYADGARPFPERDTVRSYGGRIHFLPLHPGRSTTDLVDRILKSAETACPK
jgi:rfaE bifunctional protein nucleotidyltransferase chain/domain